MPEPDKKNLISLRDLKPISAGSFRYCFAHPDDATKCIKICQNKTKNHAGFIDTLLGRLDLDPNMREYREYKSLLKDNVPLELYFPKMFGPIETDLGRGMCFELVRGSDGMHPVSLKEIMNGKQPEDLKMELILTEVLRFAQFCTEHAILASCDEPGNIGFVRSDKAFRLVAFDLKLRPNKEFIPISSILPSFRRRKIQRRFNRLIASLTHHQSGGIMQTKPSSTQR